MLARHVALVDILRQLSHVAEGFCAETVLQRAEELGVEMPITAAVVRNRCCAGLTPERALAPR